MLGRRLAPQSQPIEIVGLLFARKSIPRWGGRTTLNLFDGVARHLARNIGLRSFCCGYVVIGARTVTLGSPMAHLADLYRTRGDLLNVAGEQSAAEESRLLFNGPYQQGDSKRLL
jgi:hypothetical protein